MSASGIIGLAGPVLFLYAYAMISLDRWSSDSLRYQLLNFLGTIAILISLIDQWNFPVFIFEVCWCAISIYGIRNALKAK